MIRESLRANHKQFINHTNVVETFDDTEPAKCIAFITSQTTVCAVKDSVPSAASGNNT